MPNWQTIERSTASGRPLVAAPNVTVNFKNSTLVMSSLAYEELSRLAGCAPEKVVVMIDHDNLLMGIRALRPDEPEVYGRKVSGNGNHFYGKLMSVSGPLKKLGMTPTDVRYTVSPVFDEESGIMVIEFPKHYRSQQKTIAA